MADPDANTPVVSSLGPEGRYRLRLELGRGTMGVVYEAEDALLGRVVAVKTIELAFGVPEDVRDQFERRFFREARVAARLSHPGIVVCHDVGKDPASGKLFIVFERLRGRTLAGRLAQGPIECREALAILVKVARAIHHAHGHGVIHRDLKPANVMLLDKGAAGSATDGDVKIMDFGVARLDSLEARLTATGMALGSPLYMSPEQALGERVDARSDLFSLGSILCTMLLGRGWFDASSIPQILGRVIHDEAPVLSALLPGIPAGLDLVVARALAKRVDDRYASAAEIADDLEDVLADRAPARAKRLPHAPQSGSSTAEVDALLAGLTEPTGSEPTGGDPLASLLEEAPPARPAPQTPAPRSSTPLPPRPAGLGSDPGALTVPVWDEPRPEAAVVPEPAVVTAASAPDVAPAPAPSASPARRLARWKLVSAVVVAMLALGSGLLLLRQRSPSMDVAATEKRALHPTASPRASAVPPESPGLESPAPESPAPAPSPSDTPEAASSTQAVAATSPQALPSPPLARPTRSAGLATPASLAPASTPATPPAPEAGPKTRLRLEVEHPLEHGRLVLWVDGVLAFEGKLEAAVSKKVVGINVREGRLTSFVDLSPGRHELRVEVSWEDVRRDATTVADVAPGSTGLLEARVSRVAKDLTLEWSGLAGSR